MNPASRETHLSEICVFLLFYIKNHFVFIWKQISPLGEIPPWVGGISAKWDENWPCERVIPWDRAGNILPM